MRKFLAVLSVCSIMGVVAGCGAGQADLQQETADVPGENAGEEEREAADMLPGGAYVSEDDTIDDGDALKEHMEGDIEDDIGKAEEPEPSAESAPSHTEDAALQAENASEEVIESKKPATCRKLTEEELQEYTEFVQDISNYGFLLSEWEQPAQINLMEVFYGGAGISHEGTPEEIQAFCDRYGREQLDTDFFAIHKEDVNAFLLGKVGLTYDEILAKGNQSLEEIYYPETDSFCFEVGDTNRCMFECIDGVENVEDASITLHCKGSEWDWVQECEVKVTKEGGLLSNHIIRTMDFGAE